MKKRASIELSAGAIVILILAIIVLALSLGFVKGFFGKTDKASEELLGKEVDPMMPSAYEPITLSRNKIEPNIGSTEVIKVWVLNPSEYDWDSTGSLYDAFLGCGAADSVCYIDTTCPGNTIDPDCGGILPGCPANHDESDGICYWDRSLDSGAEKCIEGIDIDCDPRPDGVILLVKCPIEISISKMSQAKLIRAGEVGKFSVILDINEGLKGNNICSLSIFGEDSNGDTIEGFKKEFVIEVN